MGVRVVMGVYARTMLSMKDAQALFSQNELSGYPKLHLPVIDAGIFYAPGEI